MKRALLLALACVACRKTADAPAAKGDPPPTARDVTHMTWATHCSDDSDCSIWPYSTTTGCCGVCGGGFAYDDATFEVMIEDHRARCPRSCEPACGPEPWDTSAICLEGECVRERVPWTETCTTDADCALTDFDDEHDCCSDPCGGFRHVLRADHVAERERVRVPYCEAHPMRCGEPECGPPVHADAICDDGQCAARLHLDTGDVTVRQ